MYICLRSKFMSSPKKVLKKKFFKLTFLYIISIAPKFRQDGLNVLENFRNYMYNVFGLEKSSSLSDFIFSSFFFKHFYF